MFGTSYGGVDEFCIVHDVVRKTHRYNHDVILYSLTRTTHRLRRTAICPTCHIDYDCLRTEAEESGIKLYFARYYSGGEWDALRMGFGGFKIDEIEEAVEAFAGLIVVACNIMLFKNKMDY